MRKSRAKARIFLGIACAVILSWSILHGLLASTNDMGFYVYEISDNEIVVLSESGYAVDHIKIPQAQPVEAITHILYTKGNPTCIALSNQQGNDISVLYTIDHGDSWTECILNLSNFFDTSYAVNNLWATPENICLSVTERLVCPIDGEQIYKEHILYMQHSALGYQGIWNHMPNKSLLSALSTTALWSRERIGVEYVLLDDSPAFSTSSHGYAENLKQNRTDSIWEISFDTMHSTLYQPLLVHAGHQLTVQSTYGQGNAWIKLSSADYDRIDKTHLSSGETTRIDLSGWNDGSASVWFVANRCTDGSFRIVYE